MMMMMVVMMCAAYETVHTTYIEQTSVVNCQLLHTCMVSQSVGQSASTRKEGKSPEQGPQTNQLNPLSVGPHLPHRGLSALIYWAMSKERRDHRQGYWERHQTERSSCPYVHTCTVPAVTTPRAFGEVPTRQAWHNNTAHTHTHKHHNTSQHSTAQHNTTRSILTRHNTTHTKSSASWPLSCHLQYIQHSAAQLSDVGTATHTCMHGPGQRNQIPSASSRTQTTTSPSSGPDSFSPKSHRPMHG